MNAAESDDARGERLPADAVAQAFELARSAGAPETAGARLGPYRLLQRLGEGGFGVVWMAEQQEPIRRRVALKIVKVGMDTREVIARFEAERQALAWMDHPNIAHVFDAGATESGRPYFVMELVRGTPITRYCDDHRVPTDERLRLFIAVCHGVQHAHQKGIVHRDLKPSNILVTLHDGVPVPKIIDFGIAKATSGARLTEKTLFTQFHAFVGTPVYTSPEQLEMSGLDVDTRSDIYSLGVLLYELLAGRPPFDAEALAQSGLDAMRRTIREIDPPRPSQRLDTLSASERTTIARERGTDEAKLASLLHGDLDAIAMHCLEKDRTRRYETASALASDLERHLRSEPILARPPSGWYRIAKFVRRHRIGVAAVAAIVFSLLAGLIGSSMFLVRERAAHVRAIASERAQTTLRREAEEAREAETLRTSRTARDLAERLLAEGRSAEGLAWLVHAARKNPRDPTIAPRLVSAIASRNFLLPAGPPLRLPAPVMNVHYTDGGRKVAAFAEDGTVAIVDRATNAHLFARLPGGLATPGLVMAGRVLVACGQDDVLWVLDPTSGRIERSFHFGQGINRISAVNAEAPVMVILLEDRSVVVAEAITGATRTLPLKLSLTTVTALSPDGRWMALSERFGRIMQLWDLHAGECPATVQTAGQLVAAAFSPDGTRFLSVYLAEPGAFAFRLVSVPDLAAKSAPIPLPQHNPGSAQVVLTFSADGQWFSIASQYGQQVYETETCAPFGPFLPTGIQSYAIRADVRRVLSGVAGRSQFRQTLFRMANERPQVVAISGSNDNHALHVRDVATGEPVAPALDYGGLVVDTRLSDDGTTVLALGLDGALMLWDVDTGRLLAEPGMQQERMDFDFALAPDGRELVVGRADGTLQRMRTGRGAARPLVLPRSPPMMPAPFLPEPPARLLWLKSDHALALDVATGANAGERIAFPEPILGIVRNQRGIAFRADLRFLAAQTAGGAWQVWELDVGAVRRAVALENAPADTGWVCFSASRDLMAMVPVQEPQTIRFYDLQTGRELGPPLVLDAPLAVANFFRPACFSPDGQRLAAGDGEGNLNLWDVDTRQVLARLTTGNGASIFSVDVSPDGERLAAASVWGEGWLWDVATGRPIGATARAFRVAFSSNGEYLLASRGDQVRVHDGRTAEPLSEPMLYSRAAARAASFSRNARWVAVSATDGTARIWDARTGLPISEPMKHHSRLVTSEFSPDGRFLRTEEAGVREHPTAFSVWSVPCAAAEVPAPEWLLQLATLCAQKAIDDTGRCLDAPGAVALIDGVRDALDAQPDDAPFAGWGRWILDDRPERPIAPGFTITPAEADRLERHLGAGASLAALPSPP